MRILHAAGLRRRAGAALMALALATPLSAAAAWFDGDEMRLAAEADRFVADKPAELQRILHTLYMEGEWNAVLNLDLLGLAAIEAGRPRLAERAFDMAAARILRIYADDPNARQARSLWSAESVKDWKGEPYERAMTFYYRGLLYAHAGDYQNARAAFLQADIQNAFGQYERPDGGLGSFALMAWLAAWASQCAGDPARAAELAARAAGAAEPFYAQTRGALPRHLSLFEAGLGPEKVTLGETRSLLGFLPQGTAPGAPRIGYGAQVKPLAAGSAADLDRVALTRGGRPIQGILDGKAVFKESTAAVADTAGALSSGLAQAALSGAGGNAGLAQGLGAAGAAGSLLSLAAGALSSAANAEADTRYWASLPKTIYIEALAAPLARPAVQFSPAAGGKPRAALLQGRQGDCSLAWAREHSAFDGEHGGVANPSPWPAEPVESGRERANAALRNELLALPFGP
ncbi:conserved exported hypothetical protein [Cupriavidus taiwanensis]|uniref:hypothetical protein n=1 Tax=Cupriavidus taiwanensis TaxID=164546 RepID=UPI000E17267E|nr:hypothetical protein [Cupriavidus taiwanensis]SOZ18535.1 conserved exported hypothetical protein [Cupriavidus taiwanensis]SOZ31671.1 conserved exported hypothetical protein [Cupriavidus taiwanensis]SOZ47568.1 conserved exported hypothetical protein [Cupriavidus taiwanensis]